MLIYKNHDKVYQSNDSDSKLIIGGAEIVDVSHFQMTSQGNNNIF